MYKKGDIVRIRGDLKGGNRYGSKHYNHRMNEYSGLPAEIIQIQEDYYKVNIDDCYWNWTAEMFESVKPKLFKLL